ncbi:MAG: hypothetical protein DYH18_08975 [Xanthomonadales bacterium PRO7]|jgi:hypothetical protein|nr:hypothetical protein [Xanthomonadales bacterium PRO7]HMM57181.1 hypothetical protein [Rudaea sp.]
MKINRYLIASVASALAASAWAQSPTLNLNLPPNRATAAVAAPAAAKDTNKAATATVTTMAASMPALQNPPPASAQYDANANAAVDAADSRASAAGCDDAAYGQPQVHGSIGLGVVAGNHVNGNYQTGSVRMTKALGSCDHPTGMVGLSIHVGQGNFNGGNHGRGRW